jgi:hypothetical protein
VNLFLRRMCILLFLFLASCGESKDYYETSCPIQEENKWVGHINTLETVEKYAYWGCKDSECGHDFSYLIEISVISDRDFKVSCGTGQDRVDLVRLTLNIKDED